MDDAAIELTFVRDLAGPYDTRRQHARAAEAGQEHRVSRGSYAPTVDWARLTPDAHYLLRVRAVAATRRNPPVLSHWSAAAIHELPRLGPWPAQVHAIVPLGAAARSRNGFVTHAMKLDPSDIVLVDGMLVTSVERTVIDIAASSSFTDSVVVADSALYADRRGRLAVKTSPDRLNSMWNRMLPFTGHRRAREALDFAETGAATPIESVSRVSMAAIGCPRPSLQVPFFDDEGFIGDTDFAWLDFCLAAEADGARKYLDAAFRGGRSPKRVALDEKLREDRLRAVLRGFTRWPWEVARDPAKLRGRLIALGLPMGRPWR